MNAPSRWSVLANLWVVYLVWGSTYLAIRVAVETIPPFLGAGLRFVVAGFILAAFLALRGRFVLAGVTARQVVSAGLVGALLLLGGNGILMVAEQSVPSGLAALLIGSVPLWIVALRAADGQRLSRTTIASVVVGFVGVILLVLPHAEGGAATLGGPLLLIVASVSWATGSFSSQRLPMPADPLVSTSLQMTIGGLALTGVAIVLGEASRLDLSTISAPSALALAYLVVFGSLVGFSAYTWLLHHAPLSTVATYAYVNPVIAVVLGWAILAEEITPTILAGAAVILASVAFVVRRETLSRSPAPRPVEPSDATSDGAAAGAAIARPR